MNTRSTVAACLLGTLALVGPSGAAPGWASPVTRLSPALSAATVDGRVLAISIDGLNPQAILRLGPAGTPAIHRLLAEGASTLNARTEREQTETLPNHTGMVTGRRIQATAGGHGVTWNDERLRPPTVHRAAGHQVASIFSLVRGAGGSSALFAAKQKFSLFERSWPRAVATTIDADNQALVRAAIDDLTTEQRDFTLLHISLPDAAGHRAGFMSPGYLRAVKRSDALVEQVLSAIDARSDLQEQVTVILTADHGGAGARRHADASKLVNYRVPFIVWGPGISHADLYDLNPGYADPGRTRPTYTASRQPVRNGMVANLAADLLGLPAVPGSGLDVDEDLAVAAP